MFKRAPLTAKELEQRSIAGKASAAARRGKVTRPALITPAMVRDNPQTLFAFGDNMKRRGLKGQAAAMRGAPNAIGVPTKWEPATHPGAYFSDADADHPDVRGAIMGAFRRMHEHLEAGGDVAIPGAGLGTGLADLPNRAPRIHRAIEARIAALETPRTPPPSQESTPQSSPQNASPVARHLGETTPSIRQGSSGPPSRAAVGLFRQGQARPDTRPRRGPWDTRASEAPIGAINATAKFHFPKAYRSAEKLPPLPGKRLAQTLGQPKGQDAPHQDVTIANPKVLLDAHRHPAMRAIIEHVGAVIADHQAGAIERGQARGLIPEGTRPSTAVRAYKHAALRALHKAGLLDYDTAMDDAAKAEFRPLVPFMRYASRRVFDHINQGELKGKWQPFRDQFGQLYRQKKHGKLTGHERMRMRPVDQLIKQALGEDMDLAKAFAPPRGAGDSSRRRDFSAATLDSMGAPRGKTTHGHKRWTRYSHTDGFSADPHGAAPTTGASSLKEAMDAVEATMRAKVHTLPPIGGMTQPDPATGLYRVQTPAVESKPLVKSKSPGGVPADLAKADFSFRLGDPNTDPKRLLARAMRPRMRQMRPRLRLNAQRSLRRVLSGGITHQERWQLGATSRVPGMSKGFAGAIAGRLRRAPLAAKLGLAAAATGAGVLAAPSALDAAADHRAALGGIAGAGLAAFATRGRSLRTGGIKTASRLLYQTRANAAQAQLRAAPAVARPAALQAFRTAKMDGLKAAMAQRDTGIAQVRRNRRAVIGVAGAGAAGGAALGAVSTTPHYTAAPLYQLAGGNPAGV